MKHIAFLVLLAPSIVAAQIPDLTIGTRYRVTTPYGAIRGVLLANDELTFEIREPDGSARHVTCLHINQIHKSLGKTRVAGAKKGARIGGATVGALTGVYFIVSELVKRQTPPDSGQGFVSQAPILGIAVPRAAIGFGIGAVTGAFIGRARKAEEWRLVFPEPPR